MTFMELFALPNIKDYMECNAKLQQKKNNLRKELAEKGILKRNGNNAYDKYSYFSEAQYKELFTGLFSKHGLELKFTELEYETFSGSEKQSNGRMPKIQFTLYDTATGFGEDTVITGEGMDKGDKAGYKAYTGALKYYLANTFMVATGDDPEKDSPEEKMNTKSGKPSKASDGKATPRQLEYLSAIYTGDRLKKLLEANGIERLEDIPLVKASELIGKLKEKSNG